MQKQDSNSYQHFYFILCSST